MAAHFSIGKSLDGSDPSITTVMVRTQILFVLLMESLLFRVSLTMDVKIGSIIAFFGIVYMNNVFFQVDLSVIQPYLWGIFAAMCFGGMQVFIRKFNSASNPITLNFLRTALGFLIFAFVPGAIAGSANLEFDLLLLIFLAALVGPVLSRTFQIYALKTLLASQVVLIDMLAPIFGVILTFIFLGSTPSLDETVGAIIMMVGITLPLVRRLYFGK